MLGSTILEAFSDLMRVVRLTVSVYHNAMVCGNWQIHENEPGVTCFHMVTVGRCRLVVPDCLDTMLNVGDLVIFPKEIAHIMEPAEPMVGIQEHVPYEQLGEREGTGMLCGAVRFQHHASSQVLAALPAVFVIPNDANSQWLGPIVKLMLEESMNTSAASSVLIDRLSELFFIYALRHYIVAHPEQVGVLALYAHSRLSSAMNAIHQAPSHSWTLESLARCATQSRTQFAKSFREVSGITPMEYLTWWRMQLAWLYLNEGDIVASVAERVGYQSDSAFMRAFKREFGFSAGQVRKIECR
jgi:AraC-like DNA-binding protein